MSLDRFSIPRRFCGPPTSGNGGYVGGRLAGFVKNDVSAPAVRVRLSAPPPLERSLEVRREEDRVGLFDGDQLLAKAEAVPLDLTPPAAPSFAEAERATKAFRGFDDHPLPGCFVCGTDRDASDGLRIFPGPTDREGLFAAAWTPGESLRGGGDDVLDEAFVWAALDCPGAFSFPQVAGISLLGELCVRTLGDVRIGEPCVITSGCLERDGRKHVTATALHGREGDCRAYARAVWIEVAAEAVPRG